MSIKNGADVNLAEEASHRRFIQQLVDHDELEGAAKGVAALYAAKGAQALSEKQAKVFGKYVASEWPQPTCEACETPIPWDEAYHFHHFRVRCGGCQHTHDQYMKD